MSGLAKQPAEGGSLVLATARATFAEGGVLAFYRGISMTLLRAAPVAGVVLPVYDAVHAQLRAASR